MVAAQIAAQAEQTANEFRTEVIQLAAHKYLHNSKKSSQRQAVLIIKENHSIKIQHLSQEQYSLGRHPQSDIILNSAEVSRYHATICKSNHQYWIFDGDLQGRTSRNGFLVNGKSCLKHSLQHGDLITFGKYIYTVFLECSSFPDMSLSADQSTQLIDSLLSAYKSQTEISQRCENLDIFADLSFHFDASGKIINLQESRDQALAHFSRQYINQPLSAFFSTAVAQRILKSCEQTFKTQKPDRFDFALNIEETTVYCEIRIIGKSKNDFIASIQNITKRKEFEQRILRDAYHDSLTGLPNRSSLVAKIENSIKFKIKFTENYKFAILLIDLDKFKSINDNFSCLIGDRFLIQVAQRLESYLRPHDMLARMGGAKFAMLLDRIQDLEEVTNFAQRVQDQLSSPLYVDQYEFFPTARIGITSSFLPYQDAEAMLRDADTAMYQVKVGQSRLTVFEPRMYQKIDAQLQLDGDLRRAIKNQEFRLHYQPILALNKRTLIGFEALIRWAHPERGLISPSEFISQAEKTNLILPIGRWAIQEACRQFKAWHQNDIATAGLTINVNLSSKELTNPGLISKIQELLDEFELSPSSLKLEVTESIFEDMLASIEVLEHLKQLGVQIYLDDFGTGQSSLSYLHRLPIDALKIDRSFVASMRSTDGTSGCNIAHSIIDLARNLGVKVIAEGIETAQHLASLKASGCDYGQGYLFSQPLDSEQAKIMIQRSRK
jgi:diguanylate cyclase (GGDEF)-like protein